MCSTERSYKSMRSPTLNIGKFRVGSRDLFSFYFLFFFSLALAVAFSVYKCLFYYIYFFSSVTFLLG